MTTTDSRNSGAHIATQKHNVGQLAQAGQLTEARKLAKQLCKEIPHDPEIWFLLGAIHGALSEFTEAEDCCRRALATAPQHPVLNFNLAIALMRQGKAADAIAPLETAVRAQPDYVEAWHELANALSMDKQHQAAIEHYRRALELAPGSAIVHHNLGNALRDLERWQEAVTHYEKALELQPDLPETCNELASALLATYKFSRAIEVLETAIQKNPGAAELHARLGVAYQEQGESDTALTHYRNTLTLDANHTQARTGIAAILGLQGHYREACDELLRLIEAQPGNVSAVLAYAHFAPRLDEVGRAMELVKHSLENNALSDLMKSKLEFALGELLERDGEPDAAFRHYQAGNRLRKAVFDYNSCKNTFDTVRTAWSSDTLARLPRGHGNSAVTPLFIVGMPRSGTSLVEQILASHEQVFGAGELPDISNMVDNLPQSLGRDTPYPACLEALDQTRVDQLANQYLRSISAKSGKATFITDKMPSNFMHLGFIRLLFPEAKIIHCIRDARDTCLSCYFKHFSGAHPYAYDLSDLGKYYRLYLELMDHWGNTLQPPMHEIQYEQLVNDQHNETRRLLEYCGLEWSDSCLNFHTVERTVSTASHEQVRQPLHSRSIGRWKLYQPLIGPLIESLQPDTAASDK